MRIHFVVPVEHAELAAALPAFEVDRNFPYWTSGQFVWAAQSWLVLRQYREGLTFGTDVKPGVVNFAHSFTWRRIGPRAGEFRVGVRADYPRLFDVDFEILQNPAVDLTSTQAYLPYWPVPGHIERRSTRRDVKTVAYAGFIGPHNLTTEIRNGGWRTQDMEDLDFIVVPPNRWHDMSEIDLLVAIRSLDRRTYPEKPPSKLFNAWRASIPLVAGFDSAFSAVGRPGTDYVRVCSVEEFRQAILRLKEDRGFYDRIVEDGRKRASEVSHEKIALRWLDVFEQEIIPEYERWLQKGGPTRRPLLPRAADCGRNLASALKWRLLAHGS